MKNKCKNLNYFLKIRYVIIVEIHPSHRGTAQNNGGSVYPAHWIRHFNDFIINLEITLSCFSFLSFN